MFKPVPVGDRIRYSYARINEVWPMPHLIDIQKSSYDWFIKEGLREIFHDISPIKDFTGNSSWYPTTQGDKWVKIQCPPKGYSVWSINQ